jgi:hypothetical protein
MPQTPEQRATKERERRAKIASAKTALEATEAEFKAKGSTFVVKTDDGEVELSTEQRDRAAVALQTHGGLRKTALLTFILTGQTGRQQVEAARAEARENERRESQRQNVTRSADPAATDIAQKAKELAGVKSAFLPKEGRAFLNGFTVSVSGANVLVKRPNAQGVEGALEEFEAPLAEVVKYAKGGDGLETDRKTALRKQLSGLSKDTDLWGRKLAALIAVRGAEVKS